MPLACAYASVIVGHGVGRHKLLCSAVSLWAHLWLMSGLSVVLSMVSFGCTQKAEALGKENRSYDKGQALNNVHFRTVKAQWLWRRNISAPSVAGLQNRHLSSTPVWAWERQTWRSQALKHTIIMYYYITMYMLVLCTSELQGTCGASGWAEE